MTDCATTRACARALRVTVSSGLSRFRFYWRVGAASPISYGDFHCVCVNAFRARTHDMCVCVCVRFVGARLNLSGRRRRTHARTLLHHTITVATTANGKLVIEPASLSSERVSIAEVRARNNFRTQLCVRTCDRYSMHTCLHTRTHTKHSSIQNPVIITHIIYSAYTMVPRRRRFGIVCVCVCNRICLRASS